MVVELLLATIAALVIYRLLASVVPVPKRQVVQAFQRGVVLRENKVETTLEPGVYWIAPKRRLILCDIRPTPFQVSAQELLTADGMGVRVSLAGEYRVTNPALFASQSSDSFAAFYLQLKQTIRVAAGEIDSGDFFTGQAQLTARLKELVLPRETQLGIEMTRLELYEAVPIGWPREV